MKKPRIAVVSFPGNNCEVESVRVIREAGMDALYFRWNDDRSKLADVDGYFIPGGFSYEDRGRSGMIAGRDPLMEFIGQEAEAGKVVIGNCNGAQILIESTILPLQSGLQMCLARNAIGSSAAGFLNEWIWITPSCAKDRCATSNWDGTLHMPIAHGEGRFTTTDEDLYDELKKNNQIAFSYCDQKGNVSEDPIVTPNGSELAIAGLCNAAGNVVALMPHPERTTMCGVYFESIRKWIENKGRTPSRATPSKDAAWTIKDHPVKSVEIFIDTIITNNEERTVEQAARKVAPEFSLKQWKYVSPTKKEVRDILSDLSIFNANKERAYIRRDGKLFHWNASAKKEELLSESVFNGVSLLRRDVPDTGAAQFGEGSETGICYTCAKIPEQKMYSKEFLEILANPHASTLERLR